MIEKRMIYDNENREQLELNDVIRVTLFGFVMCQPNYAGTHHAHDFWELVYIYKPNPDPFLMECKNERFFCNDNSLFLIPPGEGHRFFNNGDLEAINIYIGFSFSLSPEMKLQKSLPIKLSTDQPPVSRLLVLFNELTKPMGVGERRYYLNAKRSELFYCVQNVVNWMVESNIEYEGNSTVRTMILIDRIKEFITDNLHRHISIDEIAKQFYLTPNYIGQVFRQYTGTTVKSFHNQMRMDTALRMLITGDKTVGEISYQLGFESISYFSRRFKMHYGVSPSQILLQNVKSSDLDSE